MGDLVFRLLTSGGNAKAPRPRSEAVELSLLIAAAALKGLGGYCRADDGAAEFRELPPAAKEQVLGAQLQPRLEPS